MQRRSNIFTILVLLASTLACPTLSAGPQVPIAEPAAAAPSLVIQRCVQPITILISDPQYPNGAVTHRAYSCGSGLIDAVFDETTDAERALKRFGHSVFVSESKAGYSVKLELQNTNMRSIAYALDHINADGVLRKLSSKSASAPALSVAISPRVSDDFAISIYDKGVDVQIMLAALARVPGLRIDGMELMQSHQAVSFFFHDIPVAELFSLLGDVSGDLLVSRLGESHFSFSKPPRWQAFCALEGEIYAQLGKAVSAEGKIPDPEKLAALWDQLIAFAKPNSPLSYGDRMVHAVSERALLADLLGDRARAEQLYRMLLSIREQQYARDTLALQGTLVDLANVLHIGGNDVEARILLLRASQLQQAPTSIASFERNLLELQIHELLFALKMPSPSESKTAPSQGNTPIVDAPSEDKRASEIASLTYLSAQHLRDGKTQAAADAQQQALDLYRSASEDQSRGASMQYGFTIAANQLALCRARFDSQTAINVAKAQQDTLASCPKNLPAAQCVPQIARPALLDESCIGDWTELSSRFKDNFYAEHGYRFPMSARNSALKWCGSGECE